MKINTQNYETYFLSYIDNELSADEKREIELFILENPNHANELALLQQTILEHTPIYLEDKELLYRFEEMEACLPKAIKQNLYKRETPLVKGNFSANRMRAITAVAAMLLLFIGYKFVIDKPVLISNKSTNNNVAKNEVNLRNLNNQEKATGISNTNLVNNKSIKLPTSSTNNNKLNYSLSLSSLAKESALQVISNANQQDQAINDIIAEKHITAIENSEATHYVPNTNEHTTIKESVTDTEPAETFENINTDNPDRAVYIANLEIDGDKLRGFTRRVNALLRRNKTEKEK
jgi:hypothetical protein